MNKVDKSSAALYILHKFSFFFEVILLKILKKLIEVICNETFDFKELSYFVFFLYYPDSMNLLLS